MWRQTCGSTGTFNKNFLILVFSFCGTGAYSVLNFFLCFVNSSGTRYGLDKPRIVCKASVS